MSPKDAGLTSSMGRDSLSAQTLLSTHRFNLDQFGRQNPEPAIARIQCPVLALLGTEEARIGLPEDLEIVRRNAVAASRVETVVIEGAEHHYQGHEAAVAAILARWVESSA